MQHVEQLLLVQNMSDNKSSFYMYFRPTVIQLVFNSMS